jgi:hypothetical protein
VRSRQAQLLAEQARRLRALAPGVHLDLLSRATAEALAGLPQPDYGVVPVENLDLKLVFRHDCRWAGLLQGALGGGDCLQGRMGHPDWGRACQG